MRLIVPLQGLSQGRGSLIWGSLIPCALYYFLQLYVKRKRPPKPPSPDLARSSSRANLSTRGSISTAFVSDRATSIATHDESRYCIGLERISKSGDLYDRVENPDGIIQLALSENRLCFDLLEKWVSERHKESIMGRDGNALSISGITTYQQYDGLPELKVAMAGFMSHIMGGGVSFDPSQLVLTSGVTPAIEILSFCLADSGNAFLVPAPYYPGFDRDMKWRTGVQLIPIHCRSSDNFRLTIDALKQAYSQAKRGPKIRGILISNPANPVGNLLPRETLCELLNFAQEKNIHIICDEIFAGSVYGEEKFVSMSEILDSGDYDRNRVHLVYGLSKDLSLPGFRVGAIYSFNKSVLDSARKLTNFSSISSPTQQLVISVLSDTKFIQEYTDTSRRRLREMHDLFVVRLEQLGISCTKSSAGFYCWVNMSKLIRPLNEKGELELFDKLLTIGKITVTPGSACHCREAGWFRCCFATLAPEDVDVAIGRIQRVVQMCGTHN